MSRYVGQHFAQPAAVATPAYETVAYRRSKGKVAAGVAALILVGAGGFFAGRMTAPDDKNANDSQSITVGGSVDEVLQQALSLHTAGKLDEAAALYRQVLAQDANNKFAFFNLGQIAQTRQQYDTAIEQYKLAIKADPKFGAALYNIGLAYSSKGDRANAIANLRKALEVSPDSAPTLYNLGTLLVQDGKADEGARMLAQAIALDPSLKPKS